MLKSSEVEKASHSEISKEDADYQVFTWQVFQVSRLNRRNKISSLPFWVAHGDESKQFQFRLVVLRGIVKGETEEDDPFAFYVEYIKPPPPPTTEQQEPLHPENCNIRCRLLNVDGSGSFDTFSSSTVFNMRHGSFGFKKILVADKLDSSYRVVTDDGTLHFQFAIQTRCGTIADTFAKTTEKITTSMWSSATSAFNFVSSNVKKATAALDSATHEQETQEQQNDLDSRTAEVPWDAVPPRWKGREERWAQLLTEVLPEDENTFLLGKNRVLTVEQQLLFSQMGLNHRSVMTANEMFDYDSEIHEGLLACDQLRVMRYNLVPGHTTDVDFWKNYFWKVACLSVCSSNDQAQVILSVLNAPFDDDTSATEKQVSTSDEEITVAVAKSMESVALLEDLLEDGEDKDQELMSVAQQSCAAAKSALVKLLERIDQAAAKEPVNKAIKELSRVLDRFEILSAEQVASTGLSKELQQATESVPAKGIEEETKKEGLVSPKKEEASEPRTPETLHSREVVPAPNSSSKLDEDDYFGEFPELDEEPAVSTPSPKKATAATSSDKTAAGASPEFSKMPWEEDEDE